MQEESREETFGSDLDALDIIDSGFYDAGGEYEDPEDLEDLEDLDSDDDSRDGDDDEDNDVI